MLVQPIEESNYNPREIVTALSPERLRPYLLFTPGTDEKDALMPYDIVQRLSSMLFLPLHYLEVTLRNRIHDVLRTHYEWRGKKYKELGKPEEWLLWMPRKEFLRKKINKAYYHARRNTKKGCTVNMGDVIAGLSFGVWIDVLKEHPSQASHYHFWKFTQNKIFPNATGETRDTICRELVEIKKIRNRLFYYKTIWNFEGIKNCHMGLSEILSKYDRIMRAIRWISKDMYIFLEEGGQQYFLGEQTLMLSDALLKIFRNNSNSISADSTKNRTKQ